MFEEKISVELKCFSDIAGSLANENEGMRDHMRETEQETIDVVTFLKKQDVEKDSEVRRKCSKIRKKNL